MCDDDADASYTPHSFCLFIIVSRACTSDTDSAAFRFVCVLDVVTVVCSCVTGCDEGVCDARVTRCCARRRGVNDDDDDDDDDDDVGAIALTSAIKPSSSTLDDDDDDDGSVAVLSCVSVLTCTPLSPLFSLSSRCCSSSLTSCTLSSRSMY